MKILFTTYSGIGVGGAEISMSLLAEGLRKRGHEVFIASSGDYRNGIRFKKFRKIPFYSIHNLYLSKFLSKIIKENHIDLIHAQDRLTSIAAIRAGRKFNIPFIIHFRDYWFACPRSSCLTPDFTEYDLCSYIMILKKFPINRWLWDMYKWRYIKSKWKELDKADLKFANSSVIKRRLELCGIKNNVKVLSILRNFYEEKGDGKKIKERYKLKDIVITFIGSLDYHKGIMNMLKIMPSVLNEMGNVSFLIVGDGPLYQEIKKVACRDIVLTGKLGRDEIKDVYDASDIILLPSVWQEPLSGILLEAAAYNKAIISSNTGGSVDILDKKFMIDPFDLSSWKKRIIELIENKSLRTKIGKEWGRVAREKYDVDVIAKKVEEEYENVRNSRV
ncbi:glycosyltransferase family 4 protein [Candidatus Woesearchaeota archaeon]|nr:glycosyltransferase family 4 protein [Candidatus Woesearchaeota archaeon]